MNQTTEMQRTEGVGELSARDEAKVVDSLVLRGDWSGLGPAERARAYMAVCRQHGLNPLSQPFAFLRLNGKEVLYATRGATDQLAAIHKVNREIIDGPKVIDIAGSKVAYCVAKASLPNGRTETATATLPVVDPVNLYMKLETKAKRRVTLSILGLGLLDETELDTIPQGAKEPGGGVDLTRADDPRASDPEPEVVEPSMASETMPGPLPVPPALGAFYARLGEIELPGESVAVWMKHRHALAPLPVADREAAWAALCKRTEVVGRMKNAKVWLKKAIAEEDARLGGAEGARTATQSDAPSLDEATMETLLSALETARDAATLAATWESITAGDYERATEPQRAALDRARTAREKALRQPPPSGPKGSRSREASAQANAHGTGESAANDSTAPQAWAPVVTHDGVTIEDEAGARAHIAGLNEFALRGSFARHTEHSSWCDLVVEAYARLRRIDEGTARYQLVSQLPAEKRTARKQAA